MATFKSNERLEPSTRKRAERRGCIHDLPGMGFRPAFYDCATGTIHPSLFADGTPAPVHVLDGLPEDMVVLRGPGNRVLAARASLMPGFERGGYFFTRIAAARLAAECCRAD